VTKKPIETHRIGHLVYHGWTSHVAMIRHHGYSRGRGSINFQGGFCYGNAISLSGARLRGVAGIWGRATGHCQAKDACTRDGGFTRYGTWAKHPRAITHEADGNAHDAGGADRRAIALNTCTRETCARDGYRAAVTGMSMRFHAEGSFDVTFEMNVNQGQAKQGVCTKAHAKPK